MRQIKIDSNAFIASQNEKKFLLLGAESVVAQETLDSAIQQKILGGTKSLTPGFWGTLGYADDSKIDWDGFIEISGYGNNEFEGVVKEEVELIKNCHPHLQDDDSSIKERFISFENVKIEFPEFFPLDKIPSLRLDLMLQSDEGALVFYQSGKDGLDNAVEYIQPQPTRGFSTQNRDRLKYLFDIVPQYKLEKVPNLAGMFRLSSEKEDNPFIIKIITFKRYDQSNLNCSYQNYQHKNSSSIIAEIQSELSSNKYRLQFANEHQLLIFDPIANDFQPVTDRVIDSDKKTLFLIHGTFGSTSSSFGELYGGNKTWLKNMMNPEKHGKYEQILAFDHPTLFYGAEENIAKLLMMLEDFNISSFKHEIDFIGTSQGGLLVQYLANLNNTKIKVGKAILIASANGVGYLTVGKYVAKFLSILKYIFKYTGMQAQSFIAALAQHSAEFILEQPGFQVMTPGNPKLQEILTTPPINPTTLYLPIIDDYDESLVDKDQRKIRRFIKKMGARIIDKVAQSMLGEENDWVVGTKNQYKVPADFCVIENYHPSKFKNEIIFAIHGTCIGKTEALDKMTKFLSEKTPQLNKVGSNDDLFDAHCHIFGREIITARILYLLLDELIDYNKTYDSKALLPPINLVKKSASKKTKDETGSVAINIIKYIALNKNSFQMLDALESEYQNLNSNIYRYIPLMFDLEMTFRNQYREHDIESNIAQMGDDFNKQLRKYIEKVDTYLEKIEKGEQVVSGNILQTEQSEKALKAIIKIIKTIDIASKTIENNTLTGYDRQFNELKGLKVQYGKNIFPFLAVDPRRKNMSSLIRENVGRNKVFHGLKIYTPNGYSPTDPHLFDDSFKFLDHKSLYTYCTENGIPIMAHNSNAGFATFAKELEIWGDVFVNNQLINYNQPTYINFNFDIFHGGFGSAVRERAYALNHPKIWRKVLEQHNELKICFAHFGGESKEWRQEIAQLMRDFPNVYTDLSCMIDKDKLAEIKENYYDKNDPIINRIMYGSDFFLNMLNDIKFKNYYKHFTNLFSPQHMKLMSLDAPSKFLGI